MSESRVALIVKYSDANRFTLSYILPLLESYCAERSYDLLLERQPDEALERTIVNHDVVVVMYSLMTPQIFDLVPELRRAHEVGRAYKDKTIIFVAGGPHACGDPVGTIRRLGFDVAFVSECERSLSTLLDRLVRGGDLSDVPNIAYRAGDKVVVNSVELEEDLDGYPPCSDRFRIYAPIEIMRGCRFVCKYCQTPRIYRFTVRYRSIDYVVRWCKHYFRVGIRSLRFIAPVGFAYGSRDGRRPEPDKLERLLSSIRSEVPEARIYLGTFPSEVRCDFVTKEVLDVVTKYVSNRRIAIGVQTGSNRLLHLIGRGHTIEQVYDAVDLALSYGFTPYLDYIFGLPGETEEDVEESVRTIRYFASKGCIIRGHTFMPLPGTPFERERPGRVHPKYRQAISELLRDRKIEGYWSQQEVTARRIHEYLTSDDVLVPQ